MARHLGEFSSKSRLFRVARRGTLVDRVRARLRATGWWSIARGGLIEFGP